MKEFFLNHICTTPPYTVSACEYQYMVFTTVGLCILIGGAAMLTAAMIYRHKKRAL